MTTVFLALLGAYGLISLFANRRAPDPELRPRLKGAVLLQFPLVLLSLYFAWRFGAFDRHLFSPFHIVGGMVLGHLFFTLSLLITHQSARDVAGHFVDLRAIWAFIVENPNVLFRFIGVSITEEFIYRVAAQPLLIELLGSPWLGVLAVAALFSVVHSHFFRNPIVQSGEFFGFALLLGALYHLTGSLALVIVVHTLRNLEIVFLEYLIHLDQLGDAEAAQHALDKSYSLRPGDQA